MMPVQESVSDAYDIINSLKKVPVVHIMDDSCTYVRHSISSDKIMGDQAFGKSHGCFEMPSEDKEPSTDVDCPAIEPLSFSTNISNREAMLDQNPLVHPDSKELTRYPRLKSFTHFTINKFPWWCS